MFNLSPSERTRQGAKLINLWSLLKQTKAEARAGLIGFDSDCSPLIQLD